MEFFNTDSLIIRKFEADDAAGLFDYLKQPTVNCFQDDKLNTLKEAETVVQRRSGQESQLAVCCKEDNQIIGNLFAEEEADTYNVGWNFNEKIWRKRVCYRSCNRIIRLLVQQKVSNTHLLFCGRQQCTVTKTM